MLPRRPLRGATVAVLQGPLVFVVCLVAGFRPVSLAAIPVAFFFMAMIAMVFGGLGTAIGSALKDIQGFQLIMNFIVMPMFFLSGALFPLTNIPKLLGIATTMDPLSYGIDGLRGALIGISHYGMGVDALVLVVIAATFQMLGGYFFSKIEL